MSDSHEKNEKLIEDNSYSIVIEEDSDSTDVDNTPYYNPEFSFTKYLSDVTRSEGFLIFLFCSLWYISAIFSSNSGKSIMNVFNYPVTLSIFHFLCNVIFSFFFSLIYPKNLKTKVTFDDLKSVVIISTNQVISHVVNSYAISFAPVSLVNTIKGISPFFTVVICKIVFGTKYSKRVYLSLIPLILGIAMTSFRAVGLTPIGFLFCLFAALTTTLGGIISKYVINLLSNKENSSKIISKPKSKTAKYKVLYHSAITSLAFAFPIWVLSEGKVIVPQFFRYLTNTPSFQSDSTANPPHQNDTHDLIFVLPFLFFVHGFFHTAQAFFSISMIDITSPVTFSITSLLKRVVVIIAAIIWFNQKITTVQFIGITIFFFGLYMYSTSKKQK
ncbi:putative transporter [Smittium culicis]|uniref:Putative transporter n=1 Tax=Smittium culicis TaxID=133412 RepID=A0A1R1XY26_9FUNG|nr:putative transporter [Smittium culicis]